MNGVNRPWPPLIVAGQAPRWIRWRDFVLTLLMWMTFAVMLETEFEMFFGGHLERFGFGDFDTEPHWAEFFERLSPFLVTTATLVAMLIVASLRTLQRRRRALVMPPPPPLEIADEARRAGIEASELEAARALRVAVVHIDADGTHRIEAR